MKMDHLTAPESATREQMLAELAAGLETGAAAADPRDEPLWRWLMETADAKRALPLWGGRVRLTAIVEETGVKLHTAKRYQPIADKWITRFVRAFGSPQAGIAAFDPEHQPPIDPARVANAEAKADAIEAEMAEALDHLHPVYRWLAQLARRDGSLPAIGARPSYFTG